MRLFKFFSAVMVMTMMALPMNSKKVHTLGDSTMAPYNPEATVTRGWGM